MQATAPANDHASIMTFVAWVYMETLQEANPQIARVGNGCLVYNLLYPEHNSAPFIRRINARSSPIPFWGLKCRHSSGGRSAQGEKALDMESEPTPLQVFLSYARKDEAVVHRVRDLLRMFEIEPWLDTEDLRGGAGSAARRRSTGQDQPRTKRTFSVRPDQR